MLGKSSHWGGHFTDKGVTPLEPMEKYSEDTLGNEVMVESEASIVTGSALALNDKGWWQLWVGKMKMLWGTVFVCVHVVYIDRYKLCVHGHVCASTVACLWKLGHARGVWLCGVKSGSCHFWMNISYLVTSPFPWSCVHVHALVNIQYIDLATTYSLPFGSEVTFCLEDVADSKWFFLFIV